MSNVSLYRNGLAVAFVVFLFIATAEAGSWPGLKVSGQNVVDASGNNFVLQGFGVGEWTNTEAYMLEWPDGKGKYLWYYGDTRIHSALETLTGQSVADQFWQRWNANMVSEADVAKWQGWGVNSIRMSINYHWLSPADGVYLENGWQRINQLIVWCKAHHIYVILCLHAAPGAQSNELMADSPDGIAHLWTEPATYQPWTIHLWQTIAQRYVNEPTVAGYDLLDEPIPPHGQEGNVRAFYVKVTQAIRSVDTNHILFIEGLHWAGDVAGMKAILPVLDSNMVLVFHKYWDTNNLASIKGFLKIRSKNNVPLWNGETGENSNAWAKGMAKLLARNNIGWSWWTYKKVNNSTQPCSIPEPTNYRQILKYVNGGPQPTRESATTIMRSLSENTATSNCKWNSGLVEALFRAPAN